MPSHCHRLNYVAAPLTIHMNFMVMVISVFSTCMDSPVFINLAGQRQPGCLVLTTWNPITSSNQAIGGELTVHILRVTKSLSNGAPRPRPQLSVSDICYKAIKAAKDPSVNSSTDFLRRVSNQMVFIGLPESWRLQLPSTE